VARRKISPTSSVSKTNPSKKPGCSRYLALFFLRAWRWRRYDHPKLRFTFKELHSITTQKTERFITTAMRISHPAYMPYLAYSATNNSLPNNGRFRFQGYAVKINRKWEIMLKVDKWVVQCTVSTILQNWFVSFSIKTEFQPVISSSNGRGLPLIRKNCDGFARSINLWSQRDPLLGKHIPNIVNRTTSVAWDRTFRKSCIRESQGTRAPRMTALVRTNSNCKRQNRLLVREGAPRQQNRKCLTITKTWS
jgi:hypothetical protein